MAHKRNDAITPTEQNVPLMDRPSIAFAWFLDSMVLEDYDDTLGPVGSSRLVLVCSLCSDMICDVEAADNLRVLLNTALAHTC